MHMFRRDLRGRLLRVFAAGSRAKNATGDCAVRRDAFDAAQTGTGRIFGGEGILGVLSTVPRVVGEWRRVLARSPHLDILDVVAAMAANFGRRRLAAISRDGG